jgi:tetratricopeptide (TPR) repeat protein
VVRAIVLHLEGKLEQAIQELRGGIQNGEPAVELYTAMGALQLELERFEDAAASYREVLTREPANSLAKQNLALCEEKLVELRKPPKPPASLVKAIVLHMEKKLDEAIKELNRGIKAGEQSVDVYSALGHLQFEVGRFDAAAEAYSHVLKREPLHQTCHYNLAVCLEKLGRHKDALASFQKAFEINSQRVEMGIGVGVSLLHLKRYGDAATAFEACLRTHPDDEAGLFGKAFALQVAGSLPEAEAAYLEVLNRNPSQEEALTNLIAITVAQHKDAGTREHCAKLLALRPDSRIALEALVAADLAAGNFEAASQNGEALTRAAADSFEAWFNYGVACHGAHREDDAAAAFAKAARIRPKSFEAHTSLGQALQTKGDLSGAKSAYEAALKISSDNPAVLWNLVLVSEQTGAIKDAEKYCAALAAKSPKSDALAFRLGSLRFQQGDYAGSVEAFRNCITAKPDSPAALLNLGLALWKSGNREEARQKLESVTAAPYVIEALHHLAIMAVEREDYMGALGCYMRLVESGERTPELHYNTGLILQNLGRSDEAATQFREALKVKPDMSEAIQALAMVSRPAAPNDPSRKNGHKEPAPAAQLLKSR